MQNRTVSLSVPFSSEQAARNYFLSDPALRLKFMSLDRDWQEHFLNFYIGKETLLLTYDPVFKTIFHPDIHPERLSRMLSSLLGQDVTVIGILPNEDSIRFLDTLLIMDILVKLADGSLANVEIQKIPYAFPAERMCCYSSDLIMRQYARLKGEKGEHFTYRDIKRVYTIVIFEKSKAAFHQLGGRYIHHGKVSFDTGLHLDLLQNYCLVALDVFREYGYTKDESEQTGWLALLSSKTAKEMEALSERFPWIKPIYEEMQSYLQKPGEVLNMYSEALRILDHNTIHYMIDQQQEEIENLKKETKQKDTLLAEKDALIEQLKAQLDKK